MSSSITSSENNWSGNASSKRFKSLLIDYSSSPLIELTHLNFDKWSIEAKAKVSDLHATHLLFAEPIIDEELDSKVFELIYSSISEDVKDCLNFTIKNLCNLWRAIEEKFVPKVDSNEFISMHFLRSVSFKETQNISHYTAQFTQQLQLINRNRTLISEELAIMMFIDSFSKLPKLKSLLLDYLEEFKRTNRFVSFRHVVNYANLHIPVKSPAIILYEEEKTEEKLKINYVFNSRSSIGDAYGRNVNQYGNRYGYQKFGTFPIKGYNSSARNHGNNQVFNGYKKYNSSYQVQPYSRTLYSHNLIKF